MGDPLQIWHFYVDQQSNMATTAGSSFQHETL